MTISSVNPATEQVLQTFAPHDEAETDRRIASADDAFRALRGTTFEARATWMRAAADLLEAELADVAAMMTAEMGKTLASAEAEAAKCVKAMRFYAERAEEFMAPEAVPGESVGATTAYRVWQPIGAVLAVMPWNYPLWQVMRFVAPALMAGNTVLLKHASNVPRTALYLERLFARTNFPAGSLQTLLIEPSAVERVLADSRVAAATLTGSEAAGRAVASIAGAHLKKTVMELGGSDPFIVMPSADVEAAARVGVTARFQNNGQSCIAAKRFIVHAEVYDDFLQRFVTAIKELVVGDPVRPDTDIGPLATERGRTDIEQLLADAVARGAQVECGGSRPDGPGWFLDPTVVTGVDEGMRLYREEAFGPLAVVFRVESYEDAVRLANDTPFGLGASAWTNDATQQRGFVRDLEAGAVFINGMTASHPALPFGGLKNSGYGTELSDLGLREFCVAKTVWIG